jgi:YebC/PmpR family DNA-binding regulatory protein
MGPQCWSNPSSPPLQRFKPCWVLFSCPDVIIADNTLLKDMAGHSKWAKVKRLKGALDVKKGKIFAKIGREITIAAKIGGGDPHMNPRLRMGILKARGANMPVENVERAIKKGTGGGEASMFEDLTYEVYGPHGVAMIVEISTDNRNRAAAEIRMILSRNGGSLATVGSVTRLFQRKGQMIIARTAAEEDKLMEVALEAGAEDFKAEEEGYEIITDPSHFENVHKAIETNGVKCEVAEITSIPLLTVPLSDPESVAAVTKLIDLLEDNDDVKEVYSNSEFTEQLS